MCLNIQEGGSRFKVACGEIEDEEDGSGVGLHGSGEGEKVQDRT